MNIRLGDFDPTLPAKHTPLGICYEPRGLDDYGKNRLRKSLNKLRAAGIGESILAEFEPWARALPTELPNWIDAVYLARLKDWQESIGKRLPNGATITETGLARVVPSRVRIVFHPEPFPVVQGVLTAGAAYQDHIEVVIAYLDQHDTWLRRCDQLIEWELGNWIARQFGFAPQDASLEIGNHKPA